MGLTRASSARSTLSMYSRKRTQYQKFLNLSNVFLLITSTILIFTGIILIKFYHITKLDFWALVFYVLPILMIALGVYTFFVCIYGFLISGSENRALLSVFAVLLSIAFLAQLGSIFSAMELRNSLDQNRLEQSAITEELNLYNVDPYITAKWDDLQTRLHCCGGQNFLTGYNDYRNTAIGVNNSVPDSCCQQWVEGCGRNIFTKTINDIRNTIFVSGCIQLLKDQLFSDVEPMMIVYTVVGVILALTEIITVVLACAYIAQIKRRMRREESMWRINNEGDGGMQPLSSDHETIC